MTKTILVNTVAFTEGGSFVILEDFLKNITYRDDVFYIVFCSVDNFNFDLPPNVTFINPNSKKWLKRLYWDFYGLKNWCKQHNIKPSLLFSLQSCGSRFFAEVPQIIYYHQPMPIYENKWNLFSKHERVLWLKKNVLQFIMKLFINENTTFIAQLKCIKRKIQHTFAIESSRVKIFYPTIPNDINNSGHILNNNSKSSGSFTIIYPASAMVYKNHLEIVNAIIYLKNMNYDISAIKIKFVGVHKENLQNVSDKISANALENNFIFTGYLSRLEMLDLYHNADLLLFPSYIETFGLPLVEAAKFGIPIGVASEPYAHEVLANYNGATYLPINNDEKWANYILAMQKLTPRFEPLDSNCFQPSWSELIDYIESAARI